MDQHTDTLGKDRFSLIADAAPVPMWLTGLDGRRTFVNRAYLDFVGTDDRTQVADLNWRHLLHPDDAKEVLAGSLAGEARLEPFTLEGRFRRHDGEWRWLRAISRPSWDANGKHDGFIGVAFDITDTKTVELALREREAQLSALIGQTTAGFAQVDTSGVFTLVNDRFCEIVGRSRDELMHLKMQQITHPDDLVRNIPMFERAVRDGTPYTLEKRYVRPDGSIVWVNNSVSVIRREGGEPYGVLAVTIDITDRRRSEAALRKNAESVRLAIQGAGMATWEAELPLLDGEWSPNRFDMLGYQRPANMRGRFEEWLDRIHFEDIALVREAIERCRRDGTSFAIEYRILRADNGAERWLQTHGSRIDDPHGVPSRLVGVSFDITERKRAEADLRDSEWRFRTIFEQANDYIFTSDLNQRVTSCNPAVCAALGYTPEEALGRSFADFVDIAGFEQTTAMLQSKLDQGGATRHTIGVRTRDGRNLIWEINSRLMLGADGKPEGLHAIARDVTDARRFEEHQSLLINELNHRVKNTLAIVQAIAQQTFKSEAIPQSELDAFQGRIAALATAHDLLTRDSWVPTAMTALLRDALLPHADSETRFRFEGPELMISPKTAIALALTMHELATNAIKHGALSCSSGTIDIVWEALTGSDGERRLRLRWTERGGPAVMAPERRGFGTRLIERGMSAELGGKVELHFEKEGVECRVDVPLPDPGAAELH